jgi:hypothetical protein
MIRLNDNPPKENALLITYKSTISRYNAVLLLNLYAVCTINTRKLAAGQRKRQYQ